MTRKSYHLLENTVKLDMGLKPLGIQGEGHGSCNQDRTKSWEGSSISKVFALRVSEDPNSTPPPSTHVKSPCAMMCSCNHRIGEQKTGGSLGFTKKPAEPIWREALSQK